MRNFSDVIGKYARRIDSWLYIRTRYARSAKSLENKLKTRTVVPLTVEQNKAIDTIWNGKKCDKRWFEFYNSLIITPPHRNSDKHHIEWYIPNDFYYAKIDTYYNRLAEGRALDDKNIYDLLFKGVNQPRTVGRIVDGVFLDVDYKPIQKSKLMEESVNAGSVIFKPSIGTVGGKGILFWNNSKETANQLNELIDGYKNVIIQEVVRQSDTLAQLHPSSLQTVRIMTLYTAGETSIVSVVLRMGRGNSQVDNVSAGGIAVGVDEKGALRKYAFDVNGNRFDKHPTTNVVFEGIQIPSFTECCDMVKSLAPRLGRTQRLISWDLSLDYMNNPVLIEANLTYGQLDFHQMCNGPLFKDKIINILEHLK